MKRALLALSAAGLLALAGCGTGKSSVSSADRTQAEAVVKSCLTKSKSPKAFTNCVAPKGHEAALEACALTAVTHSVRKSTLESKLADCVVKNR